MYARVLLKTSANF